MDTELYQPSQQPAASAPPAAVPDGGQIHCPSCSSTQFFGGRKTSGWGWFWLVAAILNFFVSLPLMLVGIGFVTVILTGPPHFGTTPPLYETAV